MSDKIALTRVSLDRIRNHRGTVIEVGQLTAFVGPNGSGKTSIADAIDIGVMGYVPKLGKQLMATRTLLPSDAREGSVALVYDSGLAISRRFGRSMETRVAPPKGESKESDFQTRIDEETGAFLPAFDLGAFTGLSAEKRRAWLLATLPRSAVDLTVETWRHWLGYADADPGIQQAIDRVWTTIVTQEQSILDGLASALEYTREKMNEAERKRRDQEAVVEAADRSAIELSQRPAPDAATIERLEAELAAAERLRGELDQQLREAEEQGRAVRQAAHEVRVAEMRAGRAREALAATETASSAFDPATDSAVTEARRALEQAEAAAADRGPGEDDVIVADSAVHRAERKAQSQRAAVAYTTEQLARAKSEFLAAKNLFEALRDHATCPTCGSADIVGAAERAEAATRPLEEAYERAQRDQEIATRQQDACDAAVSRARRALEEVRARRDAAAKAAAALDTARAALEQAEQKARDRAERLAGGVERARQDVDRCDAELERLRGIAGGEEPDTSEVAERRDAAAAETMRIRDDLREMRAQLADAAKAEGERERADRERAALSRLEARAAALKDLHSAQQRLRGEVIAQLVEPIEQAGNEVLQTIDPAKRFRFLFEREQRPVMDFGFEEDGEFRAFSTASTGEGAFLAVVFVAALMRACAPRWRYLRIDNAEHLDRTAQKRLMAAIARLRAHFDNVMLFGCWPFADVDGWQIIDVEQLTRGVAAKAVA